MHLHFGLFQAGQDLLAGLVVIGPRIGQCQAPCGACEELHVQALLQPRHAFADCGGGQAHAFGRSSEASGLCHANENRNALQALFTEQWRLQLLNKFLKYPCLNTKDDNFIPV
ncbi:hypothetical protein D3C79_831620 [compost metagenome]